MQKASTRRIEESRCTERERYEIKRPRSKIAGYRPPKTPSRANSVNSKYKTPDKGEIDPSRKSPLFRPSFRAVSYPEERLSLDFGAAEEALDGLGP